MVIRGLRFTHPGASGPALQGVDLAVPRGHCFGLLGPNGAGKTTLLSILSGILRPAAGAVVIDGQELGQDRRVLARSALVPQDHAFYPALTGRENLECFAGLYGLRGATVRERVAAAAATCGLDDSLDRPAASYSGGVKRRLNLAIGLLNRPAILYLDEPTVGIDAQSRGFILESIRGLRQAGMTIVYTSHYMEEIQALCDDVAVIDHGELRLQGSLEQLLREGSSRMARLVLSAPPAAAMIAALARFGAVETEGRQLRLALSSPRTSLADLLAVLAGDGLEVEQCEFGRSRLEDVYLAVTERRLRD